MKKIKKLQWIRIIIQGICFIYFPALFSQAFLGIKNIFVSIGKGTPLVLNDFSLILLSLCLLTMFFGRFFADLCVHLEQLVIGFIVYHPGCNEKQRKKSLKFQRVLP